MYQFIKIALLISLPFVLIAQKSIPYKGVLPKIDKKGVINKTTQIDGFNDPNTTVFFLVRHAEKESEDSNADLNDIGRGRAKALAKVFKKVTFKGIYSTERPRTKHTAEPLAKKKGLPVQIYDAKKQKEFIEQLLQTKPNPNHYFISGHSNTIPQLVNILTGNDKEKDIPGDDFSRIYIVSIKKIGEATVQIINY
jgi:2,3-bisphosphoglycerate-dependent phosphoglycerate mutase